MFTALRYLLSPWRLRFMRRYARPAISQMRGQLDQFAPRKTRIFTTTLLDANAEFLARAFSPSGILFGFRDRISTQSVRACLGSMLIYSANLVARNEMARDGGEVVPLLSRVLGVSRESVIIRREILRKSPRSEEWMLYTWLLKDLEAPAPQFDPALEQSFGYHYLSYIGHYTGILERNIPAAPNRTRGRAERH
jgi:hypothetical protein